MKKISFVVLILLTHLTAFSQTICIIDNTTEKPIDAVNAFNSKGEFLGITDSNGLLTLPSDLPKPDSIACTHISYKECYARLSDAAIDTIRLNQRVVQIANVDVKAPKSDYTVLHAYFRSYQYTDHELFFFADGVVDYYVPKKSSKKIKLRTREYRYFRHKSIRSFNAYGINDIDKMPFFLGGADHFAKACHYPEKTKRVSVDTIQDGNKLTVNRFLNPSDSTKERKFLKFRMKLLASRVQEVLVSQRNDFTWRREDIQTYSSFVSQQLKWGKKNKFKANHAYTEVYILDKKYQSKKQARKVRKVYDFSWNLYGTCAGKKDPLDFTKYDIPEVPVFIMDKLGAELVQYKKGMWLF